MSLDPAQHALEMSARIRRDSLPGNGSVTVGNAEGVGVTRDSTPYVGNAVTLYANVSAILDGEQTTALRPAFGYCTDGVAIFYAGHVNSVFGDPESGKTMLCLACAVQALNSGDRVAIIDLDHNGAPAIIDRLIDLGADEDRLRSLDAFRYAEPEDGVGLLAVVSDLVEWGVQYLVLDSLGEIIPLFGGSSNSPDDYTRVHALVLKPLARAGACVVVIDHLAKNSESRAMGATGTTAKKRAIGGTMLRCTVAEAFTPGVGGAAHITVAKDRHGGLRRYRPTGDKEPLAATFRMDAGGEVPWRLIAPVDGQRNPSEAAPEEDLQALRALDPPPTSVRDARERMRWNQERARKAMADYRRYRVTDTGGAVTGNASCRACGEPLAFDDGTGIHATCEVAA